MIKVINNISEVWKCIEPQIWKKDCFLIENFSGLNCIDTQPPLGDRCVQTCRNQFPAKRPGTKSNRKRHNHMIGAAHCAHLSPRVRPAVTSRREPARAPPGSHERRRPADRNGLIRASLRDPLIKWANRCLYENTPIYTTPTYEKLIWLRSIHILPKNIFFCKVKHGARSAFGACLATAPYLVLNPR